MKRLSGLISILYVIACLLLVTVQAIQSPLIWRGVPEANAEPLRALQPGESQNPAIQNAVTVLEQRQRAFGPMPLRTAEWRDLYPYYQVAERGGLLAGREVFVGAMQAEGRTRPLQIIERRLREGTFAIEGPDGQVAEISASISPSTLIASLEREFPNWRPNIQVDSLDYVCSGGVSSSFYCRNADGAFPVDLAIHCKGALNTWSLPVWNGFLISLVENSCGDVSRGAAIAAAEQRDKELGSLGSVVATMIAIWIAAFFGGRTLAWLSRGFARTSAS